jgi:hypothetical protein
LPQLAATGVSAFRLKKEIGFKVLWGPIKAGDIRRFIADGCKADKSMRRAIPLQAAAALIAAAAWVTAAFAG